MKAGTLAVEHVEFRSVMGDQVAKVAGQYVRDLHSFEQTGDVQDDLPRQRLPIYPRFSESYNTTENASDPCLSI